MSRRRAELTPGVTEPAPSTRKGRRGGRLPPGHTIKSEAGRGASPLKLDVEVVEKVDPANSGKWGLLNDRSLGQEAAGVRASTTDHATLHALPREPHER